MKSIILGLAMVLTCNLFASKIKVVEGVQEIADGKNNGFSVMLYETDADEVLKEWKKLMKDTKAKVDKSKDEIFADDVILPSVNNHPMDIYAKAVKSELGTLFIVGVDMGGVFMNSSDHKDQVAAMIKYIERFGKEQVKSALDAKVKAEEKELKKQEEEQAKLEKEKANLEAKIEGWKNDIKDAEAKIETNISEQSEQKNKVEAQKKALEAAKAKESEYL